MPVTVTAGLYRVPERRYRGVFVDVLNYRQLRQEHGDALPSSSDVSVRTCTRQQQLPHRIGFVSSDRGMCILKLLHRIKVKDRVENLRSFPKEDSTLMMSTM